jgi:hypothetical protein
MSTRSIIAKPRGNGLPLFEGVYHHNGGNPSDMGPIFWNLMHNRYHLNAEEFWKEMIFENKAGWSSITCFWPGNPNLAETWDGKTKLSVEKHFQYFQKNKQFPGPSTYQNDPERHFPGITDRLITEDSDKRMAVYVYVITPDELVIMLVDEDEKGIEKARIKWNGPEPDWDEIDDLF